MTTWITLSLGAAGFLLYLLYDINSFEWNRRWLKCGFLLGSLLLAAGTLLACVSGWQAGAFSGWADALLVLLALLSFGALIYCLFFAIPFRETYTDPANGRKVCSQGVYALCRHPGVLCFFALYLFLGLAALPSPLLGCGMVFSALNVAYALFQDRVTFPKTFCDYEAYRGIAPFLIPNAGSIRRAGQTGLRPHRKEKDL